MFDRFRTTVPTFCELSVSNSTTINNRNYSEYNNEYFHHSIYHNDTYNPDDDHKTLKRSPGAWYVIWFLAQTLSIIL